MNDPQSCHTPDGMPTERAVLEREWRTMRFQLDAILVVATQLNVEARVARKMENTDRMNGELQSRHGDKAALLESIIARLRTPMMSLPPRVLNAAQHAQHAKEVQREGEGSDHERH
jgi:hypothetical protein